MNLNISKAFLPPGSVQTLVFPVFSIPCVRPTMEKGFTIRQDEMKIYDRKLQNYHIYKSNFSFTKTTKTNELVLYQCTLKAVSLEVIFSNEVFSHTRRPDPDPNFLQQRIFYIEKVGSGS